MADKNSIIEQMLEHLVNDEQQKAEELFHEYVVTKSREIYEGLIESEIEDETDEDEEVDESEELDEFAPSSDDDMGDDDMDLDSDDPTDDLASDIESDDDVEDKDPEDLLQDLNDIVDALDAKFREMKDDNMGDDDMDMGDDDMDMDDDDMDMDDEEIKDDFELETVREYVEKVPAGHGAEKKGQAEKADGSATGMKFSKNDMGGTTANILSGRNGADAGEANKGQLKGSGLLKGTPQDMKTGNINVPGANAGKTSFKKKEPGHGAEKKGAGEGSTDGQSLFRGRR
jgi:hypothetical protein